MKQLEQILNAKNNKAETRQHREKGERGTTRADGTRAGKIKTPQKGRHNRECHEGKHDKQERTCGCNENHMAVDHKSRQKRQRKQM